MKCVFVCACIVESSRVYLQPIRGIEGSDYINASFIDVSQHTLNIVIRLSVCLSAHMSQELQSVCAYGRGSVFLWRRCNALYTSGFLDDIMFPIMRPMAA